MSVLILSMDGDWSARAVADQLTERGVPHVRVDTGSFPRHAVLSSRLDSGWDGTLSIDDGPTVKLGEVSAVYYRRPSDFTLYPGMSGPEQKFARSQARAGIGGVLASLPAKWVNHPSALADAEYKPRQLAVAARCGLTVPPTLITNDAVAVRSFAAEVGELIVKPLDDPVVGESGDYTAVYTRKVTEKDLADLSGVRYTAHLFQPFLPKLYEVRLTVIDDVLFPVAIHAESDAAHVDWRSDYDHLRYELIDCPPQVAAGVARYMNDFGLAYGAFDFAVTKDGWIFLECNSGGQWGFLAEELDLPIAAAIADSLTRETR